MGELPSNGEVKNENGLKSRLERISSCCQDAAVDEHRPVIRSELLTRLRAASDRSNSTPTFACEDSAAPCCFTGGRCVRTKG